MATSSLPGRSQAGYWALVAAALGMLAGMRALLGAVLFSALVWIRFIGHFVKAQVVFAGRAAAVAGSWRRSYQPVFAFAWLSVVLFNVGPIQQHRWLLFGVCLLLGVTMLAAGGWRTLSGETHRLPAVARFFPGESLVWRTYGVIYDASLSSRCVRVSCGGRELLPLPGQLCVWAGEDRRPLAWVHADYCRKPLSNLYGPDGRIGLALARCPKDARFGVRHWVFYVMGGPASNRQRPVAGVEAHSGAARLTLSRSSGSHDKMFAYSMSGQVSIPARPFLKRFRRGRHDRGRPLSR